MLRTAWRWGSQKRSGVWATANQVLCKLAHAGWHKDTSAACARTHVNVYAYYMYVLCALARAIACLCMCARSRLRAFDLSLSVQVSAFEAGVEEALRPSSSDSDEA